MPDRKITDLALASSVVATDVLPIIVDPSGAAALRKATVAQLGAAGGGGGGTFNKVTADQGTTSGTAVNVTNMVFAIGASEVWSAVFILGLTCSAAGANVKFAIDVPASCTVGAVILSSTGGFAFITADDTLTAGVMNLADGAAIVWALIQNSTNAGNVQLRFASGDGASTATIKANRSWFMANKR